MAKTIEDMSLVGHTCAVPVSDEQLWEVTAAWLAVYHSIDDHWDLYELAEKLVDLDHKFQTWRFSHMKTVERIIGFKRGTGGTGGVSYLAKALELRFFPELWSVRTAMAREIAEIPAIADAFCATRLGDDWGIAFGTLPVGVNTEAIIERAFVN